MQQTGGNMPRGITPRRPAKTGRHEAAKFTTPERKKTTSAAARNGKFFSGSRAPAPKTYKPLAPRRVEEILKRLNHLYPEVTCALTHRSAWELLVATILSAQ